MFKKTLGLSFAVMVVAGSGTFGDAQETDQKKQQSDPQEFIDQYNERFEKKEPVIGTKIVDLKAFDENGNAINFNDLRGKYTVLTFGCLT